MLVADWMTVLEVEEKGKISTRWGHFQDQGIWQFPGNSLRRTMREQFMFIYLGMAMTSSVPLDTSGLKSGQTKRVTVYNVIGYNVSAKG